MAIEITTIVNATGDFLIGTGSGDVVHKLRVVGGIF
jgi:hypothetical protein